MSQEDVDIVRQAWEASQRHDNAAALALFDPEIEIEPRGEITGDTYHGREGVQQWLRDLLSAFADTRSEVEEWIDAGDQEVIAMVRSYGRGRRSGVPVDKLEAHLWTVRNGRRRRLQIFDTKPTPSKPPDWG